MSKWRCQRLVRISGPVKDGNRNMVSNILPSLPAMKGYQIVGAHQPDKAGVRECRHKCTDRIGGKREIVVGFKRLDPDSRGGRQFARHD